MNKLTIELKEEIGNEYNIPNEIIEKIEDILNIYEFTNEQYILLVKEIVSEYATNNLNKEIDSFNVHESLAEIIKKVVTYKLKDTEEHEILYADSLNGIIEDMENEILKR